MGTVTHVCSKQPSLIAAVLGNLVMEKWHSTGRKEVCFNRRKALTVMEDRDLLKHPMRGSSFSTSNVLQPWAQNPNETTKSYLWGHNLGSKSQEIKNW